MAETDPGPADPHQQTTHRLPEVAPQDDDATQQMDQVGLGVITRWRRRHAERTIERMDHKDRLYEGLGQIATAGQRQAPTRARPQTTPERLMDWRLQRKSDKQARANVYAYRAATIHGHDDAPDVPSIRHGATESALGLVLDRDHSHSFGQVLWGNVRRLFEGPHISGYTPLKRKIEKGKVIGRIATSQVTAAEARQQWLATKAEQPKLGNKMLKLTRRKQRKHAERASIVSEGPVRGAWRDLRRRRAMATLGHIDQGDTYLQRGAEKTEQAAKASIRAGKLAVGETVATAQTVQKGGKYISRFYADVARGAADIYWHATKHVAKRGAKSARSVTSAAKSKLSRK
jgi:hypothetical protein